jgi:D-glycero-D-manno-heptose 1,7-bisphosphate phosphatase
MRTKIIFLDRDGVINRFPGMGFYVTRQREFRFLPGVKNALKTLSLAGFEINIISNQGCVSRGLISVRGLKDLTDRMVAKIVKAGGRIKGVFYCVHQQSDRCDCKKPKTKLFRKALNGRRVDLQSVYFIGDSEEDIQAAKNLGCRSILVLSGRIKKRDLEGLAASPDHVMRNLKEAARWVARKR